VSIIDKTMPHAMSGAATGALPLRQALVQAQNDFGLIVTDGDGVIIDWNAAAEQMYGYSRDEALGQPLDIIRIPGEVSALADTMTAAMAGDGSWSGDINFRRKDGSVGVSNTVAFAFKDGDGRPAVIGINRDVSERRRTQEELRETAASLRMIADNIPGHFLQLDRDLRYRFVNKGIEELYGQPRAYFIGKRVSDLTEPAVYQKIVPYLEQALVGAEATFEWERTSVGGVRRDYQTTCLPQMDASGQVAGCYALSVDITAYKQAEAAALSVKEEAEQANRTKSEFLANMSHELRTPLNAINGFSEMIFAETLGPLGNVEYQKYASYIKEAGEHLLDLINDILDISKIEAGSVELAAETIDVAVLIRTCVAMIRERSDADGVRIIVDIDEELLPLLCADKTRIKQIVLNLMSNAVKFTPAEGRVTVRVWYHIDRGFVLQVADTGIGIAAHNISKVFARFEQVESTLDRTYQGTGLGLPITKALVEQHGGTLDLHSELGVGTVVTVSLPAGRAIQPVA
jgi:PAS domain S-box-containing protein